MNAVAITVTATYPVARKDLWEELRLIERHVHWMADAQSIEFVNEQKEGVGTTFRCKTRVGPFVTIDVLTITSWVPAESMGVQHRGLVRGAGVFTLTSVTENSSQLVWSESLTFPWWCAGSIGGRLARPVLRALWRGNLRRLGARLASAA